jgi:hypothetical protein
MVWQDYMPFLGQIALEFRHKSVGDWIKEGIEIRDFPCFYPVLAIEVWES